MATSLLELFRTLSSFAPARTDLRSADWERYVDWAIAQGLAPLAAYNLEYRLGPSGAPQWARDRLLSVYQGSANDNVMKLVNFKRAVDELEGRRVVLLGAVANQRPDHERWLFGAGGALASLVWFTALGYGARLLVPWFSSARAWRVLDALIALVMTSLGLGLALG